MAPDQFGSGDHGTAAEAGVTNTADATAAFWVPDWDFFVENKQEITDRLNGIFGL